MSVRHNGARLARKFALKPVRVIRVKNGVFRIVPRKGRAYSLKKMPVSVKNLRWMDHSLRILRRKGFKRIAWRRTHTRQGRRLFGRMTPHGFPYVLVPWISGRWPSVHSSVEMRACGATLARFHQTSRRIRLFKSGAVNKLGKWPAELRQKHGMISRLVQRASTGKNNHRPMDRYLSTHGHEILMYSRMALSHLRKRGYRKICRSRRFISLCHGDGGPSNFIRKARGMHLIDFETLRIDLRAYDLYRVIYNSCKDHAWQFSIAKHILDGYQSVTKLKRQDFAMLRSLLRFPRTTVLLLSRYRRSNGSGKIKAENQFPRALAAERSMSTFFRQLDRYARR